MSRETYNAGFSKMAEACGVDAQKLVRIFAAGNEKVAQSGDDKGFMKNLLEGIRSSWQGANPATKALIKTLGGAGGGAALGTAVGGIAGGRPGLGAAVGAGIGGVTGLALSDWSGIKNQIKQMAENAKKGQTWTERWKNLDPKYKAMILTLAGTGVGAGTGAAVGAMTGMGAGRGTAAGALIGGAAGAMGSPWSEVFNNYIDNKG
jgi:hypothetical protein